MSEALESKARRAIQALMEGRITLAAVSPEALDFIAKVGSETADALERIAVEKLADQEEDSYYCYVAADVMRSIATAVLRKR